MELFFRGAGLVLLSCVLGLALSKQNKETAVVLTIAVCCMVVMAAVSFLEPVMDFLQQLKSMGQLDGELIQILFKVVGIGLVSEVAGMVCSDAGNGSMGKALQILGTAVILWLSIPVFNALLELIQDILGGI